MVILTFCAMNWRERKGSWPFMRAGKNDAVPANSLEKETSESRSGVKPEDVVGESSKGDGPSSVARTVQA